MCFKKKFQKETSPEIKKKLNKMRKEKKSINISPNIMFIQRLTYKCGYRPQIFHFRDKFMDY